LEKLHVYAGSGIALWFSISCSKKRAVMKFRTIGFGSLALVASVVVTPALADPIVADGDFTNTFSGFNTYSSGSTLQSGDWTVTTGSVDEIGGYWQSPTIGGGSVDLDGNSPGGIAQTISPSAGNYVLSFDLSGNPDGSPSTKNVTVDVGGTSQEYSYTIGGNSHSDMDYMSETLPFLTSGGPIILSFMSNDIDTPYGPVIGGISISSAVPEPFTLSLFGAGLVGAAALRRRKKA
jgi:choice-of-anchor C domain-containing protein